MTDEANKIVSALKSICVIIESNGTTIRLSDLIYIKQAAEQIELLSFELEHYQKENLRLNERLLISTLTAADWMKRARSAEKALRELDCSSCIHEGKEYPCRCCWRGEDEYKWKGPEVQDVCKE